ncbi:hypothetical protein BH10PLA1_BH10PLA1_07970 [soil metagenome]
MQKRFPALLIAAVILLCQVGCERPLFAQTTQPATQIVIKPANVTGVYKVGELIAWNITVTGDAAAVRDAKYVLKLGALKAGPEQKLDLSSGSATVQTKLDEPTNVQLVLDANIDGKAAHVLGGAVADPDKIIRSAKRPADFDAFWDAKLKQLRAIPPNPRVEPQADIDDVDYAKITLDNIHGSHVYGQIAKPKGAAKRPAILIVQYAGVYPLNKDGVVRRAKAGWLAMNIMAHDLPFDRDAQFYKEQKLGPLQNYTAIGGEDRETSYFLRMYLACVQSVDYLASRDDWDGKTLVVIGTSQGGQQSLITGGLCPQITTVIANVPGGCDVTAPLVGRAAGFPGFFARSKNDPKILEVGKYFDAANFTPRIRCPALVTCGLIDETCPCGGVIAAYNQIPGPKELIIMPLSDHQGSGNTQTAFPAKSEQWLREIVKGKTPTIQPLTK